MEKKLDWRANGTKKARDNLNEKSDFERNTETPTNEGRTFVTEQSSSSKKEEKQLAWWKKEFYLLPFSSGCFFSAQIFLSKSARAPVLVKACFWSLESIIFGISLLLALSWS